MKIKTCELIGPPLDWAVLQAWRPDLRWRVIRGRLFARSANKLLWVIAKDWGLFSPSTEWAQGGPIIDLEKITVRHIGRSIEGELWDASIAEGDDIEGPTARIAAMRCFVASKLGNEVDVPEELCA